MYNHGKYCCQRSSTNSSRNRGYRVSDLSQYPREYERDSSTQTNQQLPGGDQPQAGIATTQRGGISPSESSSTDSHSQPLQPRENTKSWSIDYHRRPRGHAESWSSDSHPQPNGKTEDPTVYRKSELSRNTSKLETAMEAEPRKFEREPTYQSHYRKWPFQEKGLLNVVAWTPPTVEFDGLTSYTTDFPRHEQKPRESCKPRQVPFKSRHPFNAVSDYRQTFVAHPVEVQDPWQKDKWKKWRTTSSSEGGISSLLEDFVHVNGRPPGAILSSSGLRPGDQTMHRCENSSKKKEKHDRCRNMEHVHTEVSGHSVTTKEKTSFPSSYADRKQDYFPDKTQERSFQFGDSLNFQTDHKDLKASKPYLRRRDDNYCPPSQPLSDETTHRTSYVPPPTKVTGCPPSAFQSFQSEGLGSQTDRPPYDSSIRRQEFVRKHVFCVNAVLEYRVVEKDGSTSHRYYEPLYVTVQDLNTGAFKDVALTVTRKGEYVFRMPGSLDENVLVP